MTSKPITVDGITFSSLRQAAAHFGQNYGNSAWRMKAGWSPEEALGLKAHKRKMLREGKQLVTSAGTFRTTQDAAERFEIDYATLQRRIELGWTPDQAVGLVVHNRPPRATNLVTCAGNSYPNAWALARAYGKGQKLVAKRIKCGWTPEQAVEIEEAPPRFRNQPKGATNKHWKQIDLVDGKEYPATAVGEYKLYLIINQIDGKRYVGITINPLWQRFNGHKRSAKIGVKSKLYNAMRFYGDDSFSIELIRSDARSFVELQQQEVEEIAKRNTIENGYNVSPGGSIGTPGRITVGGMMFPSRGSAAGYFGIEETVFNIRISRLGWTPEQAAEVEPRGKYSRNRVTVSGKAYPSMKQAAEAHGLSYQLVWDRFKAKGWTIEQALGIAPAPDTTKYQGIGLSVFGQSFSSYAECARYFGIKPESLRKRVAELGDSIEDAIRHLQKKPKAGAQSKGVTVLGESYESITKVAEHYGISVNSLKNRMRYQMQTLEDAIRYLQELKRKPRSAS